jgi:hypothetical protein
VLLAAAALLNAGAGIALGIAVTPDEEPAPAPPPPPPQTVAAGDLRMSLPPNWRRLDAAPDVAGLGSDAAAVRGPAVDAAFVMLPPENATLLPDALVAGNGGTVPAPRSVVIDGREALHYAGLDSGRTDAYAVPTSAGVATLVCVAESSVALAHGCDPATDALEVGRAAPVAADERAAFAIALPAAVADLNRARAAGRRSLARERSAGGRARVSRRLAGAYGEAVRRMSPLAGEDAASTRVVGLLEQLGDDHAALAAASARRAAGAARRAGARIRAAEARLAEALGEWTGPSGAG